MPESSSYKAPQMRALLDVAKALGQEVLLDNLLQLIIEKTTEVMEAERSSLFLLDPKTNELRSKIAEGITIKEIRLPVGLGIIGDVAKNRTLVNIPNAYNDPRFNPEIDKVTKFQTQAILCLPLLGTNGQLIGVLEVLNKKMGRAFNREDEELLEALGGQVSIALQRAQLIESYVETQRWEETLKLAHDIQMSFLPKIVLPFPEKRGILDIYAAAQPAKEVGGDLYDFFLLDDDNLCFAIGDVSGKGVPAALFMAVTKTLITAVAAKSLSTGEVLAKINDTLCQHNDASMFVTLFYGVVHLPTGKLEYSNAGHNFPYLLHRDQTLEPLKEARSPSLGILSGHQFSSTSTQLQRGDFIVLYTDGVNEAMNSHGTQYSYRALESLLKSQSFANSKDLIDATLKDIRQFVGDSPQSDDIALLSIHLLA